MGSRGKLDTVYRIINSGNAAWIKLASVNLKQIWEELGEIGPYCNFMGERFQD